MSKSFLSNWSENLITEWHPTRNVTLEITDTTPGSGLARWWLCEKEHEWEASPNIRTSQKQNCPFCANKRVLAGFNDLLSQEPEMAAQFHPTKNAPLTADMIIVGSGKKLWWVDEHGHEWEATASNRVTVRSGCPYCANKRVLSGFNDLGTTHPEKAAQFHPTKNAPLAVDMIISGSHQKLWWLDEAGHEWEEPVGQYVSSKKVSCTSCSAEARRPPAKVVKVEREKVFLSSLNPTLFSELKSELNPGIDLSQVTVGTHKQLMWEDKHGHRWLAKTYSRAVNGNGCPYCSGRVPVAGVNDLGTAFPEVAAQLHPVRNGEITPDIITVNSNRKLWWVDEHGHEWLSTVTKRTSGRGCPICSGHAVVIGVNDLLSQHPAVAAEMHPTKNASLTAEQIPEKGGRWKIWWLCNKGHEWEARVKGRVVRKDGCPECSATQYSSQGEKEIGDFIANLGFAVQRTNRSLLKGTELDVYVPEKKFAVEFNGVYWHSERAGKGRHYHHDKWLAAKEAGVQLLQVWEDDWLKRKNVILRAIAHKLGASEKLADLYPELAENVEKVFARKTSVRVLSTAEAKTFLGEHHVQGYASGSYYVGLQNENEIVRAVLVLKKEAGKVLNIVRYATYGTVVGGFTKLLKYAEKEYKPDSFITFADHMISDGGLYEKNGFIADKELRPDYMYVVGKERKHKFGYRLKRFKSDPELLWEEGLTERELAALNNLPRIWDAGKTRYRKTVVS